MLQIELNKILKTCKKHGELKMNQLNKSGIVHNEQQYKCKQCQREYHKNHYKYHKEKVIAKHAEYNKKYPEKRKEIRKKWFNKIKESSSKLSMKTTLEEPDNRKLEISKRKLIYLLWDIDKVIRKCQ